MEKLDIYQEERPWGSFRQFTHNILSTVKIITVKPGEVLSLQSHKKRAEFWRVISGEGTVEIGEKKENAIVGNEYEIRIEEKHRLSAGIQGIQIMEIATGEFDEKDIIRYEDKYGRV